MLMGFKRNLRLLAAVTAAVAIAALVLTGCSDDKTPTVTQTPFPEPAPAYLLLSVWGAAADDVWAVGQPGVILHYDGADWTMDTVADTVLTQVWGTGANDVYAIGHNGVMHHWNGSSWSRQNCGTDQDLFAIGIGPYGDLYAAGKNGTLRRRQGGNWIPGDNNAYRFNAINQPTDTLTFSLEWKTITAITPYAIGGDDANVIMANRIEGSPYRWLWGNFEDTALNLITAASGDTAVANNFMVNDAGKVYRLVREVNNLNWKILRIAGTSTPIYPSTLPEPITGIWHDKTAGQLYLTTAYGSISRLAVDGSGTETVYRSSGWVTDIWGAASDDIWAVGYHGLVLHWDGAAWTQVAVPQPDAVAKTLPLADKYGRPTN